MAPHSMETILQPPQWPSALSEFVTWCLMWDPQRRPTSKQALEHEYFADAIDPLRPRSSTSRLLGRKHSDLSHKSHKDSSDSPTLTSKPSWFRRSLIARDSAPAVPLHDPSIRPLQGASTVDTEAIHSAKARPPANKRATWTNGTAPPVGAPMPILPSIRPVSPLSNAVTAQATSRISHDVERHGEPRIDAANQVSEKTSKKIGRQLSINSNGNHYADLHRQETERALNGNGGLMSPPNGQKESFFSHLRKKARRFSGRHGLASPNGDDVEANAAAVPWSTRSSMVVDPASVSASTKENDFTELDKALQNVRYSLENPSPTPKAPTDGSSDNVASNAIKLKRHHSLPQANASKPSETVNQNGPTAPIASRTRRALQMSTNPMQRYETPEEEDELLHEVLYSTHRAARRLDRASKVSHDHHRAVLVQKENNKPPAPTTHPSLPNPYPTPSPSAKRNGVLFGNEPIAPTRPLNIVKHRSENTNGSTQWPTPPYEENEWASAAAASIFAAGSAYR